MFYNEAIATLERAFTLEMKHMDYKQQILVMLDRADDRRLKLIFCYVKAILGLD